MITQLFFLFHFFLENIHCEAVELEVWGGHITGGRIHRSIKAYVSLGYDTEQVAS